MIENSELEKSLENNYPKWYTRLAAFLIDLSILTPFIFPILIIFLGFIAFLPYSISVALFFTIIIVSSALISLYFAYYHSKAGKTLGMKLLGIELKNKEGLLISFQDAFLRSFLLTGIFGFLISIPVLGNFLAIVYLVTTSTLIITNPNQQGFHDKLFNSNYLKISEKITRAKWILGCYCGCLLFLALGIIALIILGFNSLIKNTDFLNKMAQNFKEQTRDYKVKTNSPIETNIEISRPKSDLENKENLDESNFYKACMKANPNSIVNLAEYCKCADKESKLTSDINSIVEKCQKFLESGNKFD